MGLHWSMKKIRLGWICWKDSNGLAYPKLCNNIFVRQDNGIECCYLDVDSHHFMHRDGARVGYFRNSWL